jgi:hypothetical protein
VSQLACALPLEIAGMVAFTAADWRMARTGWQSGPLIAAVHLAWSVAICLVLALRRWLGG